MKTHTHISIIIIMLLLATMSYSTAFHKNNEQLPIFEIKRQETKYNSGNNFASFIHHHPFFIKPLEKIFPYLDLTDETSDETEYWALLIAVGVYLNNSHQDRPTMLTEVENIYESLVSSNNWESKNIMKIKGRQATLENILSGFNWLTRKEGKNDVSLIYITTHGYYLNQDLPPYDEADGKDEILVPYEGFEDTSKFLWDDEINFFCSILQSKEVCLIVDSCFSGGFNDAYAKTISPSQQWMTDFLKEMNGKSGRVILMSSEEDEVSYGSTFSHYIAHGLFTGGADANHNDVISAEEAFEYAEPYVTRYGRQQPTMVDACSGELTLVCE